MEIWKNIDNYTDIYQVSNYGRFKSLSRISLQGNLLKERLLKVKINNNAQPHIELYNNNGIKRTFIASRLIYKYFKGELIKGLVIDHIDNNPKNNHIDNLQQITYRENTSKDKKNKSSKYTGVSWDKCNNKWQVNISFNGKVYKIGLFINEDEAGKAYLYVLKYGKLAVNKFKGRLEYRNKGTNSRSKIVLQYTLDNIFIKEYKSIALASKATKINSTSIGDCCNNHQRQAGGFKFKFI